MVSRYIENIWIFFSGKYPEYDRKMYRLLICQQERFLQKEATIEMGNGPQMIFLQIEKQGSSPETKQLKEKISTGELHLVLGSVLRALAREKMHMNVLEKYNTQRASR
ncbi:MAG: hypothetical protein ACLT8I_23645 [Blautia faecis]